MSLLTRSQMQRRFLDCVETAAFDEEICRLPHMVFPFSFFSFFLSHLILDTGRRRHSPTGVQVASELHDIFEVCHLLLHSAPFPQPQQEDLKSRYPELHPYMLLSRYSQVSFPCLAKSSESKVDIMTGTIVLSPSFPYTPT